MPCHVTVTLNKWDSWHLTHVIIKKQLLLVIAGKISSTPLDENMTILFFFFDSAEFPVYFKAQNIIYAQ